MTFCFVSCSIFLLVSSKSSSLISTKTKSAPLLANLLATPDFQAVKFEVFNNKMVVSKSTPDVGESREEIPVNYSGNEMVVGFNPNFLIDFLKNIEDSEMPKS